ncbi:splicing factor, CC1 family protein [Cardiosporidium cionae]|uniref:Splicing factor, CC1 family protein n=1 Tax=Cardiosporidium cionae TaxID=476202 RepID=A0ABQ7JDI9_9APIC|nr:splicing factor, CC1 family protein [Cardiosporidium cionae]|eukprot:KAF8822041.1 splicing factor, CC1 family protein [Cardiosporidium cionae]
MADGLDFDTVEKLLSRGEESLISPSELLKTGNSSASPAEPLPAVPRTSNGRDTKKYKEESSRSHIERDRHRGSRSRSCERGGHRSMRAEESEYTRRSRSGSRRHHCSHERSHRSSRRDRSRSNHSRSESRHRRPRSGSKERQKSTVKVSSSMLPNSELEVQVPDKETVKESLDMLNMKKEQEEGERLRREEESRQREEELRRKREIEEARRDDMTVLVLNLNLKATERDVYEFFAEHAGKVRDIQCIKDQRSGRAKGVAYVEFYMQESVIKALAMSGQILKGQPIRVQASQAEKNRAAKAAKIQQTELVDGPMRIYAGGLVESLSNITSQEIKQLFSPFGEILSVDIQRDPYTGRSKGYAFIQFKHTSEAKEAMSAMNGYVLAGRPLKVGYATDPSKASSAFSMTGTSFLGGSLTPEALLAQQLAAQQMQQQQSDFQDTDRLDDDGGGLLSGASSKLALMQKLQRDGGVLHPSLSGMNVAAAATDAMVALAEQEAKALAGKAMANGAFRPDSVAASLLSATMPANNITANMILSNMFTPSEIDLEEDPDFYADISEDVRTECSKHGNVAQVWINTSAVDGKIWVKFESIDQALRAFTALNGRYFGGQAITIEFVNEAMWQATCR